MSRYDNEFQKIKAVFKKMGWKVIKDPQAGSKDWGAQGVLYMNLRKNGFGVHVEYGYDDCVFGEVEN